jgi:hypothetical protein
MMHDTVDLSTLICSVSLWCYVGILTISTHSVFFKRVTQGE